MVISTRRLESGPAPTRTAKSTGTARKLFATQRYLTTAYCPATIDADFVNASSATDEDSEQAHYRWHSLLV
jgi:hypothetical protein